MTEPTVLDAIDGWPAGQAAAGITGPTSFLTTHGDVDRRFPLASVTKVLCALAVWVAVEEETVALDDPAGPPGATVRHLLAHASGLGPEEGDGVLAAPGERRIYSNAGFEALAALVAERAGMAFDRYLHDAVVAPLGLARTELTGSAAHGATSTVADLLVLGQELLTPTLVSTATLAEATAPAFPALAGVLPGYGRQDPNPWGLGVEVRGHKSPHWTGATNSPATIGHFGRSGTFVWVDPAASLTCVVLTNQAFGPWAVKAWPDLSDAILAAHG